MRLPGPDRSISTIARSLSTTMFILLPVLFVACSTEPENKPPTAQFTVSPSNGTLETVFTFDAGSCTDSDDESRYLQVRWDWEGDGVWDTMWGASKKRSHQFNQHANHSVVMEVRDSWGKTDSTSITVPVGRTCVADLSISPISGTVDTLFTFDASGSTNFDSGLTGLQFRWDFESDAVWDIDWSTDTVQQHSYSEIGAYTAILEVRNQDAVADTATAVITIFPPNSAPTASFTVTPQSASYSQLFAFDATASTDEVDDDATLEVGWDWDSDGLLDTIWSTEKTITYRFAAPDTHTVTLQVRDSDGFIGSSSQDVTATNSEPTASFTFSPSSGDGYTEFTFDASGSSDPDSGLEILEVRWDWDHDGNWDVDWTAGKTADHIFGAEGAYTVDLEVRDPFGLTGQMSSTVTVNNSAPIASISVTPASGDITTTFTFDASGSADPEDGIAPLEVRWDLDGDGTWDTLWSTTKTINHVYSIPSLYEPILEVRDTGALSDTSLTQVQVDPRIRWSTTLTSAGTATAIAPDGTLYLGLAEGKVVGFDAAGSMIRDLAAYGAVTGAPAIDISGTVYFGSADSSVYAYSADGALKWAYAGGGGFLKSPSIMSDGTILAGCEDNDLYALNPDGSLKWTYTSDYRIVSDPVIGADGTVYFGTIAGDIHAVNADSTRQWVLRIGGYPDDLVINTDGSIITSGTTIPSDGSGYSSNGTRSPLVIGPDWTRYYRYGSGIWAAGLWICTIPTWSTAPILVASDGSIYSGFAGITSDGDLMWDMGKVSATASSLSGGLLYVVSNEPVLYAIEVSSQSLADGVWPKYKNDLRNTGRR